MTLIPVALAVFAPMLVEARLAASHERTQRARGGVEPEDDVYGVMRLAYPGLFAAILVDGALRGGAPAELLGAGAALFAAAKALKWWAIAALGPAWTFRVLVVPGTPLVARGPYRFLRHPNYVAVIGEFLGAALMAGAAIAGPAAIVLFGVLLRKRILVEERQLSRAAR